MQIQQKTTKTAQSTVCNVFLLRKPRKKLVPALGIGLFSCAMKNFNVIPKLTMQKHRLLGLGLSLATCGCMAAGTAPARAPYAAAATAPISGNLDFSHKGQKAAVPANTVEQATLGKPTALHMASDTSEQASFQQGIASWYGPGFHNRLTANGERYNMNALTAAHRTLPFGTMVLVKNTATGKTVTVRINDRGPYIKGRIIDLSRAAAQELGISGIQRVALYKQPSLKASGKKTGATGIKLSSR